MYQKAHLDSFVGGLSVVLAVIIAVVSASIHLHQLVLPVHGLEAVSVTPLVLRLLLELLLEGGNGFGLVAATGDQVDLALVPDPAPPDPSVEDVRIVLLDDLKDEELVVVLKQVGLVQHLFQGGGDRSLLEHFYENVDVLTHAMGLPSSELMWTWQVSALGHSESTLGRQMSPTLLGLTLMAA